MVDTHRGIPAGIMAGGHGFRLDLLPREVKALVQVGGRALIDYVLEDLAHHGVRHVVIATGRDHERLQAFVATDPRFAEIRCITGGSKGTLDAVAEILSLLGDRDHLITTCDLIASPDALGRLMRFVTDAMHHDPLMVLAATRYVNDDQPIWIDVNSDGVVNKLGKSLSPTGLAFGNMRWMSRSIRSIFPTLSLGGITRDSEFMSVIAQTHPGRVLAVDVGTVLDIDTRHDLAIAEQMVRELRQS